MDDLADPLAGRPPRGRGRSSVLRRSRPTPDTSGIRGGAKVGPNPMGTPTWSRFTRQRQVGQRPVRNIATKVPRSRGPTALHACPGAKHGKVVDLCPNGYRTWDGSFRERAIGSWRRGNARPGSVLVGGLPRSSLRGFEQHAPADQLAAKVVRRSHPRRAIRAAPSRDPALIGHERNVARVLRRVAVPTVTRAPAVDPVLAGTARRR